MVNEIDQYNAYSKYLVYYGDLLAIRELLKYRII